MDKKFRISVLDRTAEKKLGQFMTDLVKIKMYSEPIFDEVKFLLSPEQEYNLGRSLEHTDHLKRGLNHFMDNPKNIGEKFNLLKNDFEEQIVIYNKLTEGFNHFYTHGSGQKLAQLKNIFTSYDIMDSFLEPITILGMRVKKASQRNHVAYSAIDKMNNGDFSLTTTSAFIHTIDNLSKVKYIEGLTVLTVGEKDIENNPKFQDFVSISETLEKTNDSVAKHINDNLSNKDFKNYLKGFDNASQTIYSFLKEYVPALRD